MVMICQIMTVILLFFGNRGVVGPHGEKMKILRFCSYGNFGDKKSPFSLAC